MDTMTEKLRAPFPPREIEWRVIRSGGGGRPWAIIAPYVDARAVTRRLDEVFGEFGWSTSIHLSEHGALCTLSVLVSEWLSRTDGANYTNVEPVKGGISDALKRAAALFGIGKYLYYVPSPIFAELSTTTKYQHTVQIDGTKYYWKPPDIDLYAVATREYEAIISGTSPEPASTETAIPPQGAPVEEWEKELMKDLPIIATDYFRTMSYTRAQVADFCRECMWDNNKIIAKVDERTSSY